MLTKNARRASVPTSIPIVGTPVTVTGAENVTPTSIRSPARYPSSLFCGVDVSATAVTVGAARTVTVTVSAAL